MTNGPLVFETTESTIKKKKVWGYKTLEIRYTARLNY